MDPVQMSYKSKAFTIIVFKKIGPLIIGDFWTVVHMYCQIVACKSVLSVTYEKRCFKSRTGL